MTKVKFVYGNSHKQEVGATSNKHRWKLYIRCPAIPIEKLLQKVQIDLHPTFNPPRFDLTKAPFEFERLGGGVFEIGIKLFFKPALIRQEVELSHMLSFQQDVTESAITVKLPTAALQAL